MSHFTPEKPIELTIFFANAKNKMRIGQRGDQDRGHQARPVRAALRGLRFEHAERDREHARPWSLAPTSSGQK